MSTRRFLICRSRSTSAGTAIEDLGLVLHAVDAETAIRNARALGLFAGIRNLVAIPQEN